MMKRIHRGIFRKNLRGFSIAEALFSTVILAVGLTAVTLMISKGLGHSLEAKDVIVGVQLAQEGAELIRNVRDNDFARGGNGFASFPNQRHCRVNYDDSATANLDCSASQGSASRYRLGLSGGAFKHAGTPGRYSRYVYVDYQNNGGDPTAVVRSFVYWRYTGSGFPSFIPANGNASACTLANRCVYTETFLTSWKK